MIHDPLYDGNGPMYESILGDMVQCRQNPIQAVSTDTDHNREIVQSGQYLGDQLNCFSLKINRGSQYIYKIGKTKTVHISICYI